ncbi:MAG TPA: GAF domain-containing protein [Candidatus Limnocylindrales bacterium]|nr:GAF domain-containing protein [Candidatus Limnocylindrales bacterium]
MRGSPLPEDRGLPDSVQTTHVRETAANLLLGRALQALDAAGGVVVYRDVEGRWNRDTFSLPGKPNLLPQLRPILDALVDWALHTEKPVVIEDLARSSWSRYLLTGAQPPDGSVAATPLAQHGAIWGAVGVYRPAITANRMEVLRALAEVATEPLSALGAGRPEGVVPQA